MENNQIIKGFAKNIEHHSQLIHDFFNENKEVFLKDEQLRDEFEKMKTEPYPINNDESSTNQPKLLDKDKLILVYYYNFGDKSLNRGSNICAEIKQMLDKTFDYSVIPLVVPIVDEDTPTHIEILNNESLTPKQFEQIKRTEELLKEIANKQK